MPKYIPSGRYSSVLLAILPMLDKRQTGMGVHLKSQAIIAPSRRKARGVAVSAWGSLSGEGIA